MAEKIIGESCTYCENCEDHNLPQSGKFLCKAADCIFYTRVAASLPTICKHYHVPDPPSAAEVAWKETHRLMPYDNHCTQCETHFIDGFTSGQKAMLEKVKKETKGVPVFILTPVLDKLEREIGG